VSKLAKGLLPHTQRGHQGRCWPSGETHPEVYTWSDSYKGHKAADSVACDDTGTTEQAAVEAEFTQHKAPEDSADRTPSAAGSSALAVSSEKHRKRQARWSFDGFGMGTAAPPALSTGTGATRRNRFRFAAMSAVP